MTHYEKFMLCVFKELSIHTVGIYLFEFMSDEFKHEKYGYGKEGRTNFRNLLRLCIALHDFDIAYEILDNLKEGEKQLWRHPVLYPKY